MSYTVSDYFLDRIHEAGVRHVFGVPGDYALVFFRKLDLSKKIKYIGCCNELNAAYASDAYARVNGLGVVATTYVVGDLSAINGVSGAWCESSPVVLITGCPAVEEMRNEAIVHHTIFDPLGNMNMYKQITCGQAFLDDVSTACSEIDRLINLSISKSKPVFLMLPADISASQVPLPSSKLALPHSIGSLASLTTHLRPFESSFFSDNFLPSLALAAHPAIIANLEVSRIEDANKLVIQLSRVMSCPVFCSWTGKGSIPNSYWGYRGTYGGMIGRNAVSDYIEKFADVIVMFGEHCGDIALYKNLYNESLHKNNSGQNLRKSFVFCMDGSVKSLDAGRGKKNNKLADFDSLRRALTCLSLTLREKLGDGLLADLQDDSMKQPSDPDLKQIFISKRNNSKFISRTHIKHSDNQDNNGKNRKNNKNKPTSKTDYSKGIYDEQNNSNPYYMASNDLPTREPTPPPSLNPIPMINQLQTHPNNQPATPPPSPAAPGSLPLPETANLSHVAHRLHETEEAHHEITPIAAPSLVSTIEDRKKSSETEMLSPFKGKDVIDAESESGLPKMCPTHPTESANYSHIRDFSVYRLPCTDDPNCPCDQCLNRRGNPLRKEIFSTLSVDRLLDCVASHLRERTDYLVVGTGSSLYSGMDLTLEGGFVAQGLYESIGFAIPGSLGVACALEAKHLKKKERSGSVVDMSIIGTDEEMQDESNLNQIKPVEQLNKHRTLSGSNIKEKDLALRADTKSSGLTICVIGDGASQMTIQELSTIARYNMPVIIVLVNNRGFTIERVMLDSHFNDIQLWDYGAISRAMGLESPSEPASSESTFEAQLTVAIKEARIDGTGCLIEARIPKQSAPLSLVQMGHAARKKFRFDLFGPYY